ncbi:LamB/YcsF family protein [Mariniluteicoccus flavus]
MGIDLNANVGEGFGVWSHGDDETLWPQVSTVNIACGFHAGDARTMRSAVARAVERGVRICGLVGYRDLAGFGNRFLDVDPDTLAAEVVYQLGALDGLALVAGGNMEAVRLAGALGASARPHPDQAAAAVTAIAAYDPKLVLVTGSRSMSKVAEAVGLRTEREAEASQDLAGVMDAARTGTVATIHVTPANAEAVRRLVDAG